MCLLTGDPCTSVDGISPLFLRIFSVLWYELHGLNDKETHDQMWVIFMSGQPVGIASGPEAQKDEQRVLLPFSAREPPKSDDVQRLW